MAYPRHSRVVTSPVLTLCTTFNMKTTLIFGYLITFIYCSNSEEKFPETSRYSLRQSTKNQDDNLRRVPARSLTLTQHEMNMVGLRNILNKVRAERAREREKQKQNSVSVEESRPKETSEVEESKSLAH